MKAIEYQNQFNERLAKALHRGTFQKQVKKLIAMLDELNVMRANEGIEPLRMAHLESNR